MPDEMLVLHCSPTLAGIKTGNLFSCSFGCKCELNECIRSWNHQLTNKGLRILPMRYKESKALIYVYRPSRLKEDLRKELAEKLLERKGYSSSEVDSCVAILRKRLTEEEDFPHEIGLFLGYPPEDVLGFIENKAEKCKCSGCWKVYGDEKAAKETFASYKKCTATYCKRFALGVPIERLTVAC